jgi:4-amino-4-deoxy-L-arabinose transferase-like glycosyltransferase
LSRKFLAGLLVASALAIHLANLGGGTLDAWDEGLSGERAREMLVAGSWWTPLLAGAPDWNKPPLYYWLLIADYRVLGVNELAVRLPSALFGLACAALVYTIGRSISGSRAGGMLATALLLLNPHWIEITRQGLLDSGFAAATLAGGWLLAVPAPSRRRALASGVLIGLGSMLKNPLSALAFAVPLTAWRLSGTPIPRRALVLAFGAFVGVGGVWYAVETWLYGRAFLDFYVGYNIWQRATTGIEGHRTGLGLYARKWLSNAPLTLFAFVVPLGWAAWYDRARLRAVAPLLSFIALWLAVIHLAVSKRPVYLAAVYPFVAAASAPLVLDLWQRIPSQRAQRAVAVGAALVAAVFLATRYNAALDFSPDVAAAARDVAARSAPGDEIRTVDVPIQLVGFYAQRDVRRLDPRTWTPDRGPIWIVTTRRRAEALRDRLLPGRPVAIECASEEACVLTSGAAPEP